MCFNYLLLQNKASIYALNIHQRAYVIQTNSPREINFEAMVSRAVDGSELPTRRDGGNRLKKSCLFSHRYASDCSNGKLSAKHIRNILYYI